MFTSYLLMVQYLSTVRQRGRSLAPFGRTVPPRLPLANGDCRDVWMNAICDDDLRSGHCWCRHAVRSCRTHDGTFIFSFPGPIFFAGMAPRSLRWRCRLPGCGDPDLSFLFDDGRRGGFDGQSSYRANDNVASRRVSHTTSERSQTFAEAVAVQLSIATIACVVE